MKGFFNSLNDDDPRKPLARFNKVDNRGPFRDDRDISWPGGGGPRYDVPHPFTGKPCKVPRRGWVYPTFKRMKEEIEKGYVQFGPDEHSVPSLKSYLFENVSQVMRSVHFSYAQKSSQLFDKIFDGKKVFDNPKSYEDLDQLIRYITQDTDIVMDFFAGTGTTAHATYLSNRAREYNLKYICVQIPEIINSKSKSGQIALDLEIKTIAEIGKERIRRVIAKMKSEREGELDLQTRDTPEDLGFRVFKLGESHFRRWTGTAEIDADELTRQMELFNDPLLTGWKPEDVLWEIALREGLSLTSRIEKISGESAPNTIWRISDDDKNQSMLVCLDDQLDPKTPLALELTKETRFICRDAALTDELAANLALQCRLKTI